MRVKVRIGENTVGDGEPVFVIAEAGINHNGNPELAERLVEEAKKCGASAVKFQSFKAEDLASPSSQYYSLFKSVELKRELHRKLYDKAKEVGIEFLSTPFSEEMADLLEELGVSAFKIASGDLNHKKLIKYVAKKGKPVILSTGASTLEEVERAVNWVLSEGNEKIVILHCVSLYPTPVELANLKVLRLLKSVFPFPVGFSDHTQSLLTPVVATALGANAIEKHFTLSKRMEGPDHALSCDPEELKKMLEWIRETEWLMGKPVKLPVGEERKVRKLIRRGIYAATRIPKGTVITPEMLKFQRPEGEIPAHLYDKIVGRRAAVDIEKEQPIREGDLT